MTGIPRQPPSLDQKRTRDAAAAEEVPSPKAPLADNSTPASPPVEVPVVVAALARPGHETNESRTPPTKTEQRADRVRALHTHLPQTIVGKLGSTVSPPVPDHSVRHAKEASPEGGAPSPDGRARLEEIERALQSLKEPIAARGHGARTLAKQRAREAQQLQSEARSLRFEQNVTRTDTEAERRPFDAAQIAAQVHDAIDRVGQPDVSKLMQTLGGRNAAELREVEQAYNDHYGAVTRKDFRQTLEQNFSAERPIGKAVRALLQGDPASADAHAIHHFAEAGLKGRLGVDRDSLQDLLKNRTPAQRRAILAAHRTHYGEPLTRYLHAQIPSSAVRNSIEDLLCRSSGIASSAFPHKGPSPLTLGGRLAELDKAFSAWHGTDVDQTLSALRGMSPAETTALQNAYAERHGGKSLAAEIQRRLSGRNETQAMVLLEGQKPLYGAQGQPDPQGIEHRLSQAKRWMAVEATGLAHVFSQDDDILRHTVTRADQAVRAGNWHEAARVLSQHLPHDINELVETKEATARTAATVAGVGLGTLAAVGSGGLAVPGIASAAAAMAAGGTGAGVAHHLTDPNATGRQLFRSTAVGAVNGFAAGAHGPLVGKLMTRGLGYAPATTAVGAGIGGAEGFVSTLVSGGTIDAATRDAILSALAGGAMSAAAVPIEEQFKQIFGSRQSVRAEQPAAAPATEMTSESALAGAPRAEVPTAHPDQASASGAVESALSMLRARGLLAGMADDEVRGALSEIRRRWGARDGSLPDARHLEVMHALHALSQSP